MKSQRGRGGLPGFKTGQGGQVPIRK